MSALPRIEKIDPQLRRMFEQELAVMFAETARMGDASARLESFGIWREHKVDKPADVQVAYRILELMPDVDQALTDLHHLARKVVLFCIDIDPIRDADYWKEKIGKRFHILIFDYLTPQTIRIVAAVLVMTPNLNVVAASTDETRWRQMVANSARIKARVQKQKPHGRRGVLVCYGPTLNQFMPELRQYAQDEQSDIVSVSGAHDWLIRNGIKPRYHIECDPRPHKADNIAKPIDGVTYLIASVASPVLFDKLEGGDVVLWHTASEHNQRLFRELEPDAWVAGNGGNVGLRSIGFLHDLGYRDLPIFGMDCSLSPDGAEQWAGAHAAKKDQRKIPVEDAICCGRAFKTTRVLVSYLASFFDIKRALPDMSFTMYGDGLLQAAFKLYVETPFTEIPFITQEEAANVLHR